MKKQVAKLNRKLKEIEALKSRREAGDRLQHNQIEKIKKASAIEDELKNLQSELANPSGSSQPADANQKATPLLPNGYVIGDKLYAKGSISPKGSPNTVIKYGQQGVIVGPHTHSRLIMRWTFESGPKLDWPVELDHLSRSPPPPLPGGFSVRG